MTRIPYGTELMPPKVVREMLRELTDEQAEYIGFLVEREAKSRSRLTRRYATWIFTGDPEAPDVPDA